MSFFVDPELLEASMDRVTDEVLPQFLELAHFRGFVVLESDHGTHRQVRVMSFWDDHMAQSETASQAFIDAVYDIVGTNPSREIFDIRAAMLIDHKGARRVVIP
jgi:hypothetical protein